jgi:hypothetical protein
VVVLPALFGPRKPTISPSSTVRSTPRTACTVRFLLVKSRARPFKTPRPLTPCGLAPPAPAAAEASRRTPGTAPCGGTSHTAGTAAAESPRSPAPGISRPTARPACARWPAGPPRRVKGVHRGGQVAGGRAVPDHVPRHPPQPARAASRLPEEARYLASLPPAKAIAVRLDSRADRERARAANTGNPPRPAGHWSWPGIATVAIPAVILLVIALA